MILKLNNGKYFTKNEAIDLIVLLSLTNANSKRLYSQWLILVELASVLGLQGEMKQEDFSNNSLIPTKETIQEVLIFKGFNLCLIFLRLLKIRMK